MLLKFSTAVNCKCTKSCLGENLKLKQVFKDHFKPNELTSDQCFVLFTILEVKKNGKIERRLKDREISYSLNPYEHPLKSCLCEKKIVPVSKTPEELWHSNWSPLNSFLKHQVETHNLITNLKIYVQSSCKTVFTDVKKMNAVLQALNAHLYEKRLTLVETPWSLKQLLLENELKIYGTGETNNYQIFKVDAEVLKAAYLDRIVQLSKKAEPDILQ